ncbi:hypothetical protein PV762_25900 [Mitsuaria sp. CC2]|uniref:hypothetical protein n=1 Tax=Mitsuaria sp. CC2 TaxID=3029186 RepID=UPI003B8D26DD
MYSETWTRLIDESLAGPKGIYELIARKRVQGVVEEWERQSMPAHACSGYFGFGVWVGVSAWESGEAKLLLGWAREIALRALADPRFEIVSDNTIKGWRHSSIFPGNHATVRVILEFSDAMLNDRKVDNGILKNCAEELAAFHLLNKGKDWINPQVQGGYLRSIQWMLIAGDAQRAQELLKVKRNFKLVNRLREWLGAVVESVQPENLNAIDGQRRLDQFDQYFDVIRAPDYRAPSFREAMGEDTGQMLEIMRFELALIRSKFFQKNISDNDWKNILAQVAR